MKCQDNLKIIELFSIMEWKSKTWKITLQCMNVFKSLPLVMIFGTFERLTDTQHKPWEATVISKFLQYLVKNIIREIMMQTFYQTQPRAQMSDKTEWSHDLLVSCLDQNLKETLMECFPIFCTTLPSKELNHKYFTS